MMKLMTARVMARMHCLVLSGISKDSHTIHTSLVTPHQVQATSGRIVQPHTYQYDQTFHCKTGKLRTNMKAMTVAVLPFPVEPSIFEFLSNCVLVGFFPYGLSVQCVKMLPQTVLGHDLHLFPLVQHLVCLYHSFFTTHDGLYHSGQVHWCPR